MNSLKAVLIILALSIASTASAQSKGYAIIPSDKSATCAATVQALDEALQVVSFPEGQKFLVACDEQAWAKVSAMHPELNDTHHAGTFITVHTTIIRGAMMGQNIDKFHNLHVLRHEAWHQRLMTADEEIVISATSREENGQRIPKVQAQAERELKEANNLIAGVKQ